MSVDVILVTEAGTPLEYVSGHCVENGYRLIVVQFSKNPDIVSAPIFDLKSGVILTLFRSSHHGTLSSAVCNAVFHCNGLWFFLINDDTFHTIRYLKTIRKVAETVPRLASIRSSQTPGIHPANYNPLFGTLYATRVLKEIKSFESTVPDVSMVAYDWARAVRDQGWAHIATYVEGSVDSPPSVSAQELESDFTEEKSRDELIILQGDPPNWMGSFKKRPWHYKATVIIPHHGKDLRLLTNILESWRLQTEPPYMVIYDTGTPFEHHASLRALASYDTEVHFCRWHGVKHRYDPVAMAYNHGMTDCRTKHLIFTHNDVVPNSQTLVTELISSCFDDIPVVGYESFFLGNLIGTQLTAVYMPTMRKIRAFWDTSLTHSWIEEGFTLCLDQAGIKPRFIGREKQGRCKTVHFDHVGSMTTTNIYVPESDRVSRVKADLEQVLKETEERLQVWRGV